MFCLRKVDNVVEIVGRISRRKQVTENFESKVQKHAENTDENHQKSITNRMNRENKYADFIFYGNSIYLCTIQTFVTL